MPNAQTWRQLSWRKPEFRKGQGQAAFRLLRAEQRLLCARIVSLPHSATVLLDPQDTHRNRSRKLRVNARRRGPVQSA